MADGRQVNSGQDEPSQWYPSNQGSAQTTSPRMRFSAGPPVPPVMRQRRKRSFLPVLLFGLLSVILGATAVYLYIQERDGQPIVAPTAQTGQNQYVNVDDALQTAGLDVNEGTRDDPQATSPASFPTRIPGQYLSIEGHDAWVYIFPGTDECKAAVDAYTQSSDQGVVTTVSGRPLTEDSPMLFHGSNAIVLVSLDTDITKSQQDAIAAGLTNLP